MKDDTVLKIEDISRRYGSDVDGEVVNALDHINLSIKRGEFISIIGASGCGKTTLLRLIAGLDQPQGGKILLNDKPIGPPDSKRGYVFQQGSLFPWLTVEQNIAAGLRARHVYRQEKDKVSYYIHLTGLEGFETAYPHQISGGMAQRVAIARALINDPEVLLLDEPMGALDSFTRADIQEKLLELQRKSKTTMLLVTHDVDEAIYLSDRVVIMTPRPGKIREIMEISSDHPRDRGGVRFTQMRLDIMDKFHLASTQPQPEYMI